MHSVKTLMSKCLCQNAQCQNAHKFILEKCLYISLSPNYLYQEKGHKHFDTGHFDKSILTLSVLVRRFDTGDFDTNDFPDLEL